MHAAVCCSSCDVQSTLLRPLATCVCMCVSVASQAALRIPVSKQLEQLRQRFLALQAETQAAAAAAAAAAATGGGQPPGAAGGVGSSSTGAASTTGGHGSGGRSGASHSSKSSAAAHAQQQLIAGFAPVPMGPDT
jgi:hypothetical protein